jgi:hypothetical protein
MEQGNSSVRDGLLSRLPQPENLAAYREETESLLAKHKKALAADRWTGVAFSFCALVCFFMVNSLWGPNANSTWYLKLPRNTIVACNVMAGVFFFLSILYGLQQFLYRNQVMLLKEVKQVQLQVLELQASLRKGSDTTD